MEACQASTSEVKKKSIMVWTEAKDIKLLRAMGAEGVFVNSRAGSRERGAAWVNVVSALMAESIGHITSRSVRDRYQNLAGKWKAKVARQEKESGGGDEHQMEVEVILEELVALELEAKRAEEQDGAKKEAAANEKKQAVEMRDRALERFGETRKRHTEEKEGGKKETKRRSGGEALDWLKEKGEIVRQLKEQEVENRREEREVQRMQHEQFMRQLETTKTAQNEQAKIFQQQMLQQMQQNQQQQQQQQFAMLQHQLMLMLQRLHKKDQ